MGVNGSEHPARQRGRHMLIWEALRERLQEIQISLKDVTFRGHGGLVLDIK